MAIPQEVTARVGEKVNMDDMDPDQLKATLMDFYNRWVDLEDKTYDVGHVVKMNEMQINELQMEVSDMRGKFILPKLKKVHNFKLMGGEE